MEERTPTIGATGLAPLPQAERVVVATPRGNLAGPEVADALMAAMHGLGIPFVLAIEGRYREVDQAIFVPSEWGNTIVRLVRQHYQRAEPRLETGGWPLGDMLARGGVGWALRELVLANPLLPILQYRDFVKVDPTSGFFAALTELEPGVQAGIYIILAPMGPEWYRAAAAEQAELLAKEDGNEQWRKAGLLMSLCVPWVGSAMMWYGRGQPLNTEERDYLYSMREKASRPLFQAVIAAMAAAEGGPWAVDIARRVVETLVAATRQFGTRQGQSFQVVPAEQGNPIGDVVACISRFEPLSRLYTALSTSDVASLWHLPVQREEDIGAPIVGSIKLPLPREILNYQGEGRVIGEANYGPERVTVVQPREDYWLHWHIVGSTGTGKTTWMVNRFLEDVEEGLGAMFMSQHAGAFDWIERRLPRERVEDVVYCDLSFTERPFGFNPLAPTPGVEDALVGELLVGCFSRIWGRFWGPESERLLRAAIFTLIANRDTMNPTVLDIGRMLVDKSFRRAAAMAAGPELAEFWLQEFESWPAYEKAKRVAPLSNKIDALTHNPYIRNIMGQPASSFSLREVLDSGKVLLVRLDRRQPEISALLGATMMSLLSLVALSRRPGRPFLAYVDEFHTFVSGAFVETLSQARQYRFFVRLAHQHMGQLDKDLQASVLANAQNLLVFRAASAEDAHTLHYALMQAATETDIGRLENYTAYARILFHGQLQPPFLLRTWPLPPERGSEKMVRRQREKIGRPREEVERDIRKRQAPGLKFAV